ncbi:MAG: hypothetical protein EOO73_28885 [Myxococcales bacterium]|nr:MAG: hypothetical protein EOO73_28885 [Myxococcales bacterium]
MLKSFFLGPDDEQRPQRWLLLACVLVGLGLRVFNFAIAPPSLWQDEAYWAVKAVKTAAIDAQIRPLGFMLVTQLLLRTLQVAGWVYRLLPFAGSLLSMGLAPYVALRLFKSGWVRALSVLLLALSPVALEMAVEFKHYGVEVGVYVGILAALLFYRDRPSWSRLALLLGAAWASFFFSLTIIFFYPAVFGWLLLVSFRQRQWRRVAAAAGVALLCLGTITTIYFTTWRTIKTEKAEKKWGTFYDVFYTKNGPQNKYDSRATWSTAKYFELAGTPGVGRVLWRASRISEPALDRLRNVDWAVWSALHLAGLAYLLQRRRYLELFALWTPLLLVTAFNFAGRWPAGAFRTNTFYVPFAIFLSCHALEWLSEAQGRLRRATPAAALLLLLPTLYFRPGLTEKGLWAKPGDFPAALALLPLDPPSRERTLIMDFASCRPWDYYTVYDAPTRDIGPTLRRRYKDSCQRQTRKLEAEMRRRATPKRGFWLLMTDQRKYDYLQGVAREICEKAEVQFVRGRTHMLVRCTQGK